LEKRLREEQALREAAQAKLRVSKKKEEAATTKVQKMQRANESPVKGANGEAKNLQNGDASSAQTEKTAETKQTTNTANTAQPVAKQTGNTAKPVADGGIPKQPGNTARAVSPAPGGLKKANSMANKSQPEPLSRPTQAARSQSVGQPTVPRQPAAAQSKVLSSGAMKQEAKTIIEEPDSISKPTAPNLLQQPTKPSTDPCKVETSIAEKNLAELDATMTTQTVAGNASNGIPLLAPPIARQRTNESVECKSSNNGRSGQMQNAPNSPVRVTTQGVTTTAVADVPKNQLPTQNGVPAFAANENAPKTAANGPAAVSRSTLPANPDNRANGNPAAAKATAVPKIPSAIEFDPLKTASVSASDLNPPLDANGRSSPVDMQSITSMNGCGLTSADVGLGASGVYSVQNQYSHQYDTLSATVAGSQMAFPVVGLMGYQQQQNGTYQQTSPMMPVGQQQFSQVFADAQNAVLQQPFLQVSSDQQSIHSMPVADFSQPMILIQPQIQPQIQSRQHHRGASMNDFSPDALMAVTQMPGMQDMTRPPAHHSRTNSFQTFNAVNMNDMWNQNGQQWATMMAANNNNANSGQATPPSPPPDPFDELVSRRPVSAMQSKGK